MLSNRNLSAVFFLLICSGTLAQDRQADVRQRGGAVMSFSLDATQHVFDKTDSGGVQRVVAKDGHSDQAEHIRHHLRSIADSFAKRDFSGPAHIHGDQMPGLAELRAAPSDQLSIEYREIDQGAEIRYTGHSPAIVAAIHQWFDAQISDHGHDAMSHMP